MPAFEDEILAGSADPSEIDHETECQREKGGYQEEVKSDVETKVVGNTTYRYRDDDIPRCQEEDVARGRDVTRVVRGDGYKQTENKQ